MIGVPNVGALALLEEFDSPNGTRIVETDVKLGDPCIASEEFHHKRRRLYYCCVQRKANLVDYVLNYLQLSYLDFPVLHILNAHTQIILNVSPLCEI